MLQEIREKTQGWFAWVIVILISIPFALWGINEYLGGGGEPKVAKINGREISERELDQRFQQFRMQLREQLGANYQPGLFDDNRLKQQVLSGMVQQELLMQMALKNHMNISDAMVQASIAQTPVFQKAGQFDYEAYQRGLRQVGLNPQQYVQRERIGLMMDQLKDGIVGSDFSTEAEIKAAIRLKDQKRSFGYLVFTKDLQATTQPDAPAIEAYYKEHQKRFMTQERAKLSYIELNMQTLASELKVEDKNLQAYLEQHLDDFRLPQERRVAHILVEIKDGDAPAALTKIQALQKQLAEGADFAELAKKESQDPGSADKGGDLGFVSAAGFDPAFDKAVAALEPGKTSEPVKTAFGYHLIKLLDERGGGTPELSQVRERVQAAYMKDQIQGRYSELSDRMINLAFENPGSLDPISEALGLPLQASDWISRSGGEGVFSSAKAVTAAFSSDVLEEGHNSEVLELSPEHLLVVRLLDYQPAKPKPLDEVREEISTLLRQEAASKAVTALGEKALEAVKSGQALEEVAKANGLEASQPGLVNRYDAKLDRALVAKAFRMPKPVDGKVSLAGLGLPNGDYALLALTEVVDGVVTDEARDVRQALEREQSERELALFMTALEQAAKIEYFKPQTGRVED